MLGMDKSAISREIDRECFGIADLAMNIKDQPALQPNDILRKLATGVAKAIAANNAAIENQLRQAGIQI